MLKGYKIRIYPTSEQLQTIMNHINGCRFVWNWALTQERQEYQDNHKTLSAFDLIKRFSQLKQKSEYSWLYDISNASCQTMCRDMHQAYERFFKKISRLPNFRSKKSQKLTFPPRADSVYFTGQHIHMEKIGNVKYKSDFVFAEGKRAEKILNPRVKKIDGKWYLCFVRQVDNQDPIELNLYDMGIDVGIKNTAIVAYDNNVLTFPNINKSKQLRSLKKKLRYYQRILSRKIRMNMNGRHHIETKNMQRIRKKIRYIAQRLHGLRMNYIHQCTHQCVLLKPQKITIEDLEIRRLLRRKQSRSKRAKRRGQLNGRLVEQCLGAFLQQIQYKGAWSNITIVLAPSTFPSSQICSCCGHQQKVTLNERVYVCAQCGFIIDRDENAAINLMKYKTSD